MNWRNRRLRLALVLAAAVFVAFVAWRMGDSVGKKPPCVPGRHEEKDTSGKVVKITHISCFD
ncbi:hypothetical protein IAG41_04690 [Sphingomonas sp. JC676]|uniref:hypothetical protein n=1 Tax=Sphingomonas sp. JC676 TaxID=2768065 RepID=UPI0016580569|nr:hypothetical protein [Sphingomonas sp. JC676]MBC9031682.1 hypothetical protein [Sphingomonas sp. JC676]